ncbi:glycosyltransferase [Chitinophaga cymbidii]|nr:glycosyltransferase [Chitinophaga cymbidii]
MRIAHVIFSLQTGGAEHMLVDIINEQVSQAEVALFVLNNEVNPEIVGRLNSAVRCRTFGRREGSRNPVPVALFNAALLRGKFDVIHCHNLNMAALLLPSLRRKAMLTVHDTISTPENLTRYNRCFAISYAVRDSVQTHAFTHCRVIQNGVNFNEIAERRVIPLRTGNFRILQAGRLRHKKKGQHVSIEALRILNERGIHDVEIDFIGEGPSCSYLQKLAEELGVSSHVRFLGCKDRAYVYNNIQCYDLMVQPSVYEGFGLTIVEAMAAKVPVLASAIEGPMEVLDSGRYGFLFEKESAPDMADKIIHIMGIAPEAMRASVDKAYDYALERFSVKRTARDYLEEYRRKD